jgi:hypothetical protein
MQCFFISLWQPKKNSGHARAQSEEATDWLLELMMNLGDEYSRLLGQLHIEFPSASGIGKSARAYRFQTMTEAIWEVYPLD